MKSGFDVCTVEYEPYLSVIKSKDRGVQTMKKLMELWLCGEIASGKDFISGVLKREGFCSKGVGELIAEELESLYQLSPGTIYANPKIRECYRTLLQEHGNTRRAQDPHYWLKKWCHWRDTQVPHLPAIQPSCRFIFEAKTAVHRHAFILRVATPVKVRRQRVIDRGGVWDESVQNNAAENEIARVPCHEIISGEMLGCDIIERVQKLYCRWQQNHCPPAIVWEQEEMRRYYKPESIAATAIDGKDDLE